MFPPEKLKLKQILSDAILLLCRSALPFDSELSVQALVGVTCDQSDVCLVSIEEVIKKSATDGQSEDELRSSSVWRGSTDGVTHLSSSPPAEASSHNTSFATEKYHPRKKKLPGSDRNGQASRLAVCSDGAKSARPSNYENYEVEQVINKRRRFEHSTNQTPSRYEFQMETNHSKRKSTIQSFLNTDQNLQLVQQQQQRSDSSAAVGERPIAKSTDIKHAEHNTSSSEVIEIKMEPVVDWDEEEAPVKEEFTDISFTNNFQDDGSPFSFYGIHTAPWQSPTNDKNLNFPQSEGTATSLTLNESASDVDQQLDVSISTLICQHVLKYEGPFVTVRDIQRRKLRQVSANHIKSSMNQLTMDGLGFYKTLCLGIMVFYKCPPSIINPNVLQKYNVSHEYYEHFYNQKSYVTSSNRHSDNYWERITMSSPYGDEIVR